MPHLSPSRALASRLRADGVPDAVRQARQRAASPKFIPRQHLMQWAIDAAEQVTPLSSGQAAGAKGPGQGGGAGAASSRTGSCEMCVSVPASPCLLVPLRTSACLPSPSPPVPPCTSCSATSQSWRRCWTCWPGRLGRLVVVLVVGWVGWFFHTSVDDVCRPAGWPAGRTWPGVTAVCAGRQGAAHGPACWRPGCGFERGTWRAWPCHAMPCRV